jgi:hypothetical protein
MADTTADAKGATYRYAGDAAAPRRNLSAEELGALEAEITTHANAGTIGELGVGSALLNQLPTATLLVYWAARREWLGALTQKGRRALRVFDEGGWSGTCEYRVAGRELRRLAEA